MNNITDVSISEIEQEIISEFELFEEWSENMNTLLSLDKTSSVGRYSQEKKQNQKVVRAVSGFILPPKMGNSFLKQTAIQRL